MGVDDETKWATMAIIIILYRILKFVAVNLFDAQLLL